MKRTEEKMDKLVIIKRRYNEESKYGDLAEAGRMAKVTGSTVKSGLNRKSFKELKKGEEKGILQLLKILDKRKKEQDSI